MNQPLSASSVNASISSRDGAKCLQSPVLGAEGPRAGQPLRVGGSDAIARDWLAADLVGSVDRKIASGQRDRPQQVSPLPANKT